MSRWLLVVALLCGLGTLRSAHAGLGDPTQPPNLASVAVETLDSGEAPFRLSSILIAPERQVAIVNGARVEVGDEVSGATVIEISAWAVLLEMAGEEIELRITGSPVKVAAKSADGEDRE